MGIRNLLISLGIAIFLLFGYIVTINFVGMSVYESSLPESSPQQQEVASGGFNENIGMQQSTAVSVRRERWWGKTIETADAQRSIAWSYIFGLVRLPTMVNGNSWWFIHGIVLAIDILSFMGISLIPGKKRTSVKQEPEKNKDYFEDMDNNSILN